MEIQYKDINDFIVERCKEGDKKAQYELYKLYSKAMFNVSIRITNDYAEAEDVLQESFLSAFQNIHSYSKKVAFGSWLKRIVINHSINAVKKKRLETISITEGDDYKDTYDEFNEEDFKNKIESIRNSIPKLPDGYRIILSLYALEGYSHKDIAEIMQISESTSKSQYSRAKKKLLDLIKEN